MVTVNSVCNFNLYKKRHVMHFVIIQGRLHLVDKPLYVQGQSNVDFSPLPVQTCLLEYQVVVQVGTPERINNVR